MLHTHLMVTDRLLVAQGRWLNSALARALAVIPDRLRATLIAPTWTTSKTHMTMGKM